MRRRTFLGALLSTGTHAASAGPWSRQRTGANCFNREVSERWLDAASQARIGTVRLTYEKWDGQPSPPLRQLVATLDRFHRAGIGVIVTPLSLPGARWRQMNGDRRDGRLWTDKRYWNESRQFWRDLARALRQHPAIVALDLLNEPAPELEHGRETFWTGSQAEWQTTVSGTAGDLNGFYRHVVDGIREVDANVPLILESGLFATPWAIESLNPIPDANLLYSIHMYEPYEYTTWRKHKGRLRYPGKIRIEATQTAVAVDAQWLDTFFDPVRAWMTRHSLPASRLLVGEFGCGRRCPGAARYLSDLIRIFDREGWHWLFYAFREDNWDGMDYELGAGPPPEWYWKLAESGDLSSRYDELYAGRVENPSGPFYETGSGDDPGIPEIVYVRVRVTP